MSLLSRLETMLGPSRTPVERPRAPRSLPPGRWIAEGIYLMEATVPLERDEAPLLPLWGDRDGALCFDLETTGLAGGTGTYAFLAGVGWIGARSIETKQLFLTSPAFEEAWLTALEALLPPTSPLVTYNGKRFDVPLLQTRRTLHRKAPLEPEGHLDLLHLARALWSARLPSCRLGEVERSVLGLRRSGDDVPGSLVPDLYRDFLRSGDAAPLEGVFYHNRMDLVALALLRDRVALAMAGRHGDGAELVAAGRAWQRAGGRDEALALWRKAREEGAEGALECLARSAKSDHRWEEALTLWEEALSASGDPSVAVELAKACEHRLGDIARARLWAEEARRLLDGRRPLMEAPEWRRLRGEIDHRLRRLARKESAPRRERV